MRVNGCNFVQKLGKQWDKQQLSWISVEGLATSVWNIWSIAHVPEGVPDIPDMLIKYLLMESHLWIFLLNYVNDVNETNLHLAEAS